MTRTRRFLVGAVAALVIFATAAAAMAQTCTLTLKRRETKSARGYADSTDYMLWSVRPQYFSVQINAQGKVKSRPVISGDKSQEEHERIAIAAHGVRADVADPGQVIGEEATHGTGERMGRGTHRSPAASEMASRKSRQCPANRTLAASAMGSTRAR